MPPEYNKEINVGVSISPEGVVELVLGGNVSSYLHKAELEAWVEEAKAAIAGQKKKQGGIATCLVNVEALRDFDEESVAIVKDLAGWHESADVKTAVIGGTLFSNMALRTIIIMTGRKNIKSFDSKDDALEWLKSSDTQ